MANRLRMAKIHSIQTLHARGWSQRRIARALGVDRETVARYVRADAAGDQNQPNPPTGSDGHHDPPTDQNQPNPPAGSSGPVSRCEPFRERIGSALQHGLSAKRIWQDLRVEQGFEGGYDAVKRFCRRLQFSQPLPFRRIEVAPGEEAQVDFGRGAPVLAPGSKSSKPRYRRPHVLRVVLSHSRKGYSEAVDRQTTDNFIRCLENAFQQFGGVPRTLVIDNLKAAVTKADWFEPELNPKLQAFAEHCGTVILPTKPYTPRHKGKVERGVDYVQENGLKGRTFDSLAAQNRFLAEWETTVADTRIHGTTRQQVGKIFDQVERPALLPLPATRFPCFQEGQRVVNRDGHVEVAHAYYSVPPEHGGRRVWVRWDNQVVRIFNQRLVQIAIHARREPGRFATDDRHIAPEKRRGIERGTAWWLHKAAAIGDEAGRWAQTLIEQRGIHALRAVMGLVSLTQRHRDAEIEQACRIARSHAAWRLRDVRNLLKRQDAPQQDRFEFTAEHPLIRSLSDYGRLVQSAFEEVHA
ncbi:Integrase core domain protein [Phycisphaerae bacterium RAS1]|nr:Integrase core domain protein [Phycisphaerae bacterium RAS1]